MFSKFRQLTTKTKTNPKILTALIAGLILGGGSSMVALASIPDSDGKINACYSNVSGAVRIIDSPGASCSGSETAVAWDQSSGPGKMLSNFTNADLTNASLQHRDFRNVDFANANLGYANFSGADLRGADLTEANMYGTQFGLANLSNADMSGNVSGASFSVGGDVTGLDLTDGIFGSLGGDFRNAIFSNTTIAGLAGNMSGLDFDDIILLSGAHIQYSELEGADFSGLTLDNTHFMETNLTNADFTGTILTDGRFNDTDVSSPGLFVIGADFTNAQFNGTYLLGADFSGATLTGATWSNATCPDGTNSNSNGNTCIGHLIP